jgi:hypothetical protein
MPSGPPSWAPTGCGGAYPAELVDQSGAVCEAEDVDSHAGGITIELAILGDVVFVVAVDEDEVAGTRSG